MDLEPHVQIPARNIPTAMGNVSGDLTVPNVEGHVSGVLVYVLDKPSFVSIQNVQRISDKNASNFDDVFQGVNTFDQIFDSVPLPPESKFHVKKVKFG